MGGMLHVIKPRRWLCLSTFQEFHKNSVLILSTSSGNFWSWELCFKDQITNTNKQIKSKNKKWLLCLINQFQSLLFQSKILLQISLKMFVKNIYTFIVLSSKRKWEKQCLFETHHFQNSRWKIDIVWMLSYMFLSWMPMPMWRSFKNNFYWYTIAIFHNIT